MASYRTSAGRLGEHVRDHVWVENRAVYVLGSLLLLEPLVTVAVMGARWRGLESIAFFVAGPTLGLWMIVDARRRRSDVVALHERGLFHRRRGVEHEVAYEEVVSIDSVVQRQGLTGLAARVSHHHVVHTRDGIALEITHGIDRVESLIDELRRRARLPVEPD